MQYTTKILIWNVLILIERWKHSSINKKLVKASIQLSAYFSLNENEWSVILLSSAFESVIFFWGHQITYFFYLLKGHLQIFTNTIRICFNFSQSRKRYQQSDNIPWSDWNKNKRPFIIDKGQKSRSNERPLHY